MAELFPKELLDKFDWSFTGLTGRNGHDTTLWIGTKGAHTPCHQVIMIDNHKHGPGVYFLHGIPC